MAPRLPRSQTGWEKGPVVVSFDYLQRVQEAHQPSIHWQNGEVGYVCSCGAQRWPCNFRLQVEDQYYLQQKREQVDAS